MALENENDIVTQLAEAKTSITTLTGERDTARTALTAMTGERDTARTSLAAMTTERDTARTQLATVTGERDAARNDVTRLTAERNTEIGNVAKLTESQKDFDGKVRAELLKHGVRPTGVTLPVGDTKADGSKMTLTEKCMAAKAGNGNGATK